MKIHLHIIMGLFCLGVSCPMSAQTQTQTDIRPLSVGQPIERELKGDEAHSYSIAVTSGQFLHVVVDQRGIDVVVTLFGVDSKKLAEVDSPNGTQGSEPILIIVEATGAYRLEVRSLEQSAPGHYEAKIIELRTATEKDKNQIAAQTAFAEGEALRSQGTAESLRGAIKKYEKALFLYHVADDKRNEAKSFTNIGEVYSNLGEAQKALEYFNQSLSLFRAVGDQRGEADTLNNIGAVCSSLGEKQKALEFYNQALLLQRAVGNKGGEAATLNNLGRVYADLGEMQKALEFYNRALPLFRAVGDRTREAYILNNIGGVYSDLGEKQKALEFYNQALSLRRAVGDQRGEATTLNNIGGVYSDLGEKQKALEFYNQALPLRRAVGDQRGEAYTLNNIGSVYADLGEKQKALEYFNQSLSLFRAVGDQRGEADTFNNIGSVYADLGEKQKALEFFNQALPLRRAVGNKRGEADTLNSIGGAYSDLGEMQKALEFYNRALPLFRAVGDKDGEAYILNNIGAVYDDLGEKRKALEFFNQALSLYRAVGDRGGESLILNNFGGVYSDLGEKQKALEYYNQALLVFRALADKRGEAYTLNNIGTVYNDLGEKQQALKYYDAALPLRRAVGDKRGEAVTLQNLFSSWVLVTPPFGVFFGKQSVNTYQILRSNLKGLDKDVQQTFLKSIEKAYRNLADALIKQQRFAEAQQVLNLFKDQQYFDFNSNIQAAPLALTMRENELVTTFNQKLERIVAVIRQLDDYKRTIGRREPNKSEAEQIQLYEADLKAANDDYLAFLNQAETDFSQPLSDKDRVGEIPDTKEMQTALRNLRSQTGQKAVAIYTLEANENYRGLLITPDKIVAISYPIKAAELRQKAITFLGQLNEVDKRTNAPKSSESEVQKTGKELYDIVFAPVAAKLKELNNKPDLLMWSLDGALRYVPVAALYDGKQYMAERYRNVVFTRVNSERLLAPVSPIWTGSSFYSSKEYSVPVSGRMVRFDKLQYARQEVETTFGTTQKRGFISGSVMPDEQFTKDSLLKSLKHYRPLVHIASHFRLEPGDASLSFLLLGDGTTLTLNDIKNDADDLFGGVELLTLSACETGVQKERESDGREIDSFAELAQRKGAKAVMASLWRVDDESTSRLMMEFYRKRQTHKLTKAEALQKAQLSLLKHSRYSHPYYWSTFILVGNWR